MRPVNSPIEAQSPGKLLLLGEHSVVYGAPALGIPLKKGAAVSITPGSGECSLTLAPDLKAPSEHNAASPEALVRKVFGARTQRLKVDITLSVPPMSGFGSSAAIALALLKSRYQLLDRPLPSNAQLWAEALEVENEAHGKSSGVDPALCLWQQPIRFETGADQPSIEPFQLGTSLYLVVGSVGSHGGTRNAVGQLAEKKTRFPSLWEGAMETLRLCAEVGQEGLQQGDLERFGIACDLAHGTLSGLGLVNAQIESGVRQAREYGALGSKMSGAGGQGGAFFAVFQKRQKAVNFVHSLRNCIANVWLEEL